MKWEPPRGRALVLAPHPDDEVLGCGGAILLHRSRRDPVRVVFVTDGRAGDPENLSRAPDLAALRRDEAREAARLLGVDELEFWNYPDGRLAGIRGVADRVAELIRSLSPRLLYRPAADDPHPDHRALGRAVDRALRRIKLRLIDCRYEVWGAARPTAVLDISRNFARKAEALAVYRSQRPYLDPGLSRRLDAGRGLLVDARYGEGYRVKNLGQ